jgi:hypothetical protein
VIGEVTFGEVVDVLGEPQRIHGREINPVVYTPGRFSRARRSGSALRELGFEDGPDIHHRRTR